VGIGNRLRRLFQPSNPSSGALPEGWTDDLSIALPAGRSAEDVVDHVIRAARTGTPDDATERSLIDVFGLSPEDAALARDRTFAGLVRAATRNEANSPNREKDPIAWASFQRASRDPSIIATIYPQWAGQRRDDHAS